jgi:GMP synthase-like glutamine amidotransferase
VLCELSSKPALIFQHGRLGPPAYLAEWLQERGLPYVIHRAGEDAPADLSEFAFVVSLGSEHSAASVELEWVGVEIEALRAAVDSEVPVLGLCFGGQALSLALGGGVDELEQPEIGWFPVETTEPDSIPGGPWLMWHVEQLRVPPGGRVLARSAAGPAAVSVGPHLLLQFHPEVDAEAIAGWAEHDVHLADAGLTPDEIVAETEVRAPATRELSFRLFDRWLAGAVNGAGAGQSDTNGK